MVSPEVGFCPNCGAPQISVTSPGGQDELPGVAYGTSRPPPPATLQSYPRVNWRIALPITLMTGFASALLTMEPHLALGCLLWMLLAGALSVVLYSRRPLAAPVDIGAGARMGAVAGLFSSAFFVLFALADLILRRVVSHESDDLQKSIRGVIAEMVARNPSPKSAELIQQLSTPEGFAVIVGMSIVLCLLAFVIFSTIGGMIGAAVAPRQTTKIQPM